ncbi:hypothetical protein BX667DRAFT_196279 [Coemansia mojavensis]|nr:hypothetical protein BX667DRAFT_196279 [Coemansia mojavensis]
MFFGLHNASKLWPQTIKKIRLDPNLQYNKSVQNLQASYILLLSRELFNTELAYQQFLVDLNPNYIRNIRLNNDGISSLWFSWDSNWQEIASFIRANSSIIQKLYLVYNKFDGFESVFVNGQKYVTYPNMTQLKLCRIYSNLYPLWGGIVDNNHAPFPILEEFNANFDCKSIRNLVFRNNRSTLRKIYMYCDHLGISDLNNYYLMPAKKIVLKEVELEFKTEFLIPKNLESIYGTFTRSTLSTVQKLVILNISHYNALLALLPNSSVNSSIYEMSIILKENTFSNVVKLLTAFSGIRKLECCISKTSDLSDLNKLATASQILKTNGKLNTCLKEWIILDYLGEPSEHYATNIMLVTKACFNLKSIRIANDNIKLLLNLIQHLNSQQVLADLKSTLAPLPKYIYSRTPTDSNIQIVYNTE